MLAGPTASGKSAFGLKIAKALHGVVINADSMQVYRELRVVTARPGSDCIEEIPHRLYGVQPAAEPFSAEAWRRRAVAEMEAATTAGRLPILVGGTGLYLKALTGGLAPVPAIPPDVRDDARRLLAEIGPPALHKRLAKRDPVTAAGLRPTDRQRVLRAWEVLAATGRPLAEWHKLPATGKLDYRFVTVALEPPRHVVYAACDARWLRMLQEGAIDEVRALAGLGLDPELPAMKAVGVPELLRYLRGEIELGEATRLAQQATRRYVKRQMTWLRHQVPDARRFDPTIGDRDVAEEVAAAVRSFGFDGRKPNS